MDEVLQLVFIMVIIISRYIWSGLVQVFHKDIDILKIIVLNYFMGLMNLSIHIEVIGIKYFMICLFLLYYYYFEILCC